MSSRLELYQFVINTIEKHSDYIKKTGMLPFTTEMADDFIHALELFYQAQKEKEELVKDD